MDREAELERRVAELEAELGRLKGMRPRGIRKQAAFELFGLPAYAIALGPDPDKGELRGHAKGFLAIGDLATGVIALGGLARGVFAFGGLSLGVFSLGGCSVGLVLALGGAALGGVALGGAAGGGVAVGGLAVGHHALGGQAYGRHVVSAERQDPEAVAFFQARGLRVPPPRRRR